MNIAIRAAVWQVGTLITHDDQGGNDVGGLTIDQRLGALRHEVAAAHAAFIAMNTGNRTTFDVFVAPEYLFGRSSTRHFVSQEQKEHILTQLKLISRAYPNMLIFPGTVAWVKSAQRTPSRLNWARKSRTDRAISRIEAAQQWNTGGMHDRALGWLRTREQSTLMLAENTCFVVRDGKVVRKYHKRADGGEVIRDGDDTEDLRVVFVPGPRSGAFTVKKVRIGMQICAEHFSDDLLAGQDLDLFILMSASFQLAPNRPPLREGGYALHADAVYAPKVKRREGGNNPEVTRVAAGNPQMGRISYYNLPYNR